MNYGSAETAGERQAKGKIMLKLKELFGEDRSPEYFYFVENNWQKGFESVIELWIQKECKL